MRLLRERFLGLQAVRYSIVDSGLGQLKRILSAEDRPVGCRSLELLVGEQREGGRRRRWRRRRRRRRRRRSGQIRQTECLSLPSAMHVLQHKDRDRVLCTEVIGLECVRLFSATLSFIVIEEDISFGLDSSARRKEARLENP